MSDQYSVLGDAPKKEDLKKLSSDTHLTISNLSAGYGKMEILHDFDLFVIEHNMRVIMQLAESIFCLAHGKMLANGKPDEIKNDKRVIDAYLGAQ